MEDPSLQPKNVEEARATAEYLMSSYEGLQESIGRVMSALDQEKTLITTARDDMEGLSQALVHQHKQLQVDKIADQKADKKAVKKNDEEAGSLKLAP